MTFSRNDRFLSKSISKKWIFKIHLLKFLFRAINIVWARALTIGHIPTRFEHRAIRLRSPEDVFKFLDWNTKEFLRKSLPDDFVNINPSIFMKIDEKPDFIVRKHRFNVPERFGDGLGWFWARLWSWLMICNRFSSEKLVKTWNSNSPSSQRWPPYQFWWNVWYCAHLPNADRGVRDE